MYKIKRLTQEADLAVFERSYISSFSERSKEAKRKLKCEELRSSHSVFAVYKGRKIVAGFVLNLFPKRCLEDFSKTDQRDIVAKLGEENVCELVGIWKDAGEKSAAATLFMWGGIIYKTLAVGRPYIFGCSRSEKVGREYYFRADLQLVPNPHSDLVVFYYTRKQFFMTFVNSLLSFAKKKSKKKQKLAKLNSVEA